MKNIKTIAFDADDTLWVNEPIFAKTEDQCKKLLSEFVDPELMEKVLYATELRNLKLFGYGIKGFMLSMIETAIELSLGKVNAQQIQKIIDLGKEMLEHPVEVLPNVKETLEILRGKYELMIITKGDLFDQESKIARSGLADYFEKIEIISEKNEDMYQQIFNRNGIDLRRFLMVGNSLKSDILPICKLGGKAVHIPYHTTWVHEKVEVKKSNNLDYIELADVSLVPSYLGIN